jgi:hypothetical protein
VKLNKHHNNNKEELKYQRLHSKKTKSQRVNYKVDQVKTTIIVKRIQMRIMNTKMKALMNKSKNKSKSNNFQSQYYS